MSTNVTVDMLTTKEAAATLDLSVNTFCGLILRNAIAPAAQDGPRRRFWSQDQLDRIRTLPGYRNTTKLSEKRRRKLSPYPYELGKVCSTCRFLSNQDYCERNDRIPLEIEDARTRPCGCFDHEPIVASKRKRK